MQNFSVFWKYCQQGYNIPSKRKDNEFVQEAINGFLGQVLRNYSKDIQMTFKIYH